MEKKKKDPFEGVKGICPNCWDTEGKCDCTYNDMMNAINE